MHIKRSFWRQDQGRKRRIPSSEERRPFLRSILVKFSRLSNMTQGTVRSSYIRLLKTLSGFEQSSLLMQRQNLPSRKYVRTFFLVVNLRSLKAHWGVLSLATLLRSVMFVWIGVIKVYRDRKSCSVKIFLCIVLLTQLLVPEVKIKRTVIACTRAASTRNYAQPPIWPRLSETYQLVTSPFAATKQHL